LAVPDPVDVLDFSRAREWKRRFGSAQAETTSRQSQKGVPMRTANATPAPRINISLLFFFYLIVGGIVAATHHYWSNLHTLKAVISALLATVLWPLLLVGINLHIH
jgi:hypothetical protein